MIAEGEELRLKVQDELNRILKSPAFHGSPRCKQFLQFVVERALDGQYDVLKERMIGIEVFGRDPAYQTDGDSVVRVRATEVRRRLIQYYSVAETLSACRIEIPSGSYIPHFLPPEVSTPPLPSASLSMAEKSGKITASPGVGIADVETGSRMARRVLAVGFLIVVVLMAFFVPHSRAVCERNGASPRNSLPSVLGSCSTQLETGSYLYRQPGGVHLYEGFSNRLYAPPGPHTGTGAERYHRTGRNPA